MVNWKAVCMIKITKNFLNLTTINKITEYVNDSVDQYKWTSNLFWNKRIIKGSAQVSILKLDENLEKEILEKIYKENKKFKNYNIKIVFYIWHNFSYIPFHNDGMYEFGATVYLNEVWEEDWGGLFLYKENNKNKFIIPEFNNCVFNFNKTDHAVSMITAEAPYRTTLQIFAKK